LRWSGDVASAKGKLGLVLDDPFNDLAALELHGLGDGRREINVPLFAVLAFDELDFGGETHGSSLD
jgi:hypothetical protein